MISREHAKEVLENLVNNEVLKSALLRTDIEAMKCAISALSGGEYIKKSELLQHVVTEELSDYQDCDVIHAEVIDELTTYFIPDSANIEKIRVEIIQDIQNGVIQITKGSERLFAIIDNHIGSKDK